MAYDFIPLPFERQTEADMRANAERFKALMAKRRTVRDFSPDPVPLKVIEDCVATAGSAPSGANRQPWHFVVVSDPEKKQEIRLAAEVEEREFYSRRASDSWLDDLAPLGTDDQKPFLEIAPYLIVVFAEKFEIDADGGKNKNYYVPESVGIATGFLLASLHNAGLATLTHTPSPMRFLNEVLGRPRNEAPSMLIVVGYPADKATVPAIERKALSEIMTVRDHDSQRS